MKAENYKRYMTAELLMGPNSLRILEELLHHSPVALTADAPVLDLGCGKGLTSFAIAKETGATVYATDLWIAEEDNAKRFDEWGVADHIIAVHADAHALPFAEKQFSALFSIDAYHYFATGKGFFIEKILPLLQDHATVLIGIPGIKEEFSGRSAELLSDWLHDEAYMFQSASAWKSIIGSHPRIKSVETFEMACFDQAWEEWFLTENKYALGDKAVFDTIIRPYTCFVGICVKLNEMT